MRVGYHPGLCDGGEPREGQFHAHAISEELYQSLVPLCV